MKFADIPKMTKTPIYKTDVPWWLLEKRIAEDIKELGLQLEPDFQRGHVWTEEQQVAFVDFKLRGGQSGNDIMMNHPGWQGNFKGDFVLVDGLQRLTAVRKFLRNDLRVFGHLLSEFEDVERMTHSIEFRFTFHVNDLKTKADVLGWYLEMNMGGTPHSEFEIARVSAMKQQEEILSKRGLPAK